MTLYTLPANSHFCREPLAGPYGKTYLNDVMQFDVVVQVRHEGDLIVVDDSPTMPARLRDIHELTAISDGEGSHTSETDPDLQRQVRELGWDGLLTGFTGQYGYNGPCFHQAEFVGGGLADWILDRPGYYVALEVSEDDGSEPTSWAIAHFEEV